jgi:hypothetical protein
MAGGGGGEVKETAAQKEFKRVALARRQDYDRRWGPLRQRFISDTLNNEPERRRAMEVAGTENARAFADVAPQVANEARRRGAGGGAALGDLAINQGLSAGMSRVDTRQAVDDRRLSNLGGLVAMGQGQAADAFRGLSDVASMSGAQARQDAINAAQNSMGLQDALFTGAGLAANQYMRRRDPKLAQNYAIGGAFGPSFVEDQPPLQIPAGATPPIVPRG